MGWDSSSSWRNAKDVHASIRRDYTGDGQATIIAEAAKNFGRHFWVVFETTKGKFISLFLIERQGFKNDSQWAYKHITESEGPFYYTCPIDFLDMAPETNAEWRGKVVAEHSKGKQTFKLNDVVEVFGEQYTIVGTWKRSFIGIQHKSGKRFRLSPKQMTLVPGAATIYAK